MTASEQPELRLAELVAALSLGIDLGFGQPMEHVLRQCLIALRLADRLGFDEELRASVYYSALLIDVGCHTDAHEQAKWFGDDLALKATKFDADMRSVGHEQRQGIDADHRTRVRHTSQCVDRPASMCCRRIGYRPQRRPGSTG